MNNYRVEYGKDVKVSYWNKSKSPTSKRGVNFRDIDTVFWKGISAIYARADILGIKFIWHFYEPYVEITWLSDDEKASEDLIAFIQLIIDYKDLTIRRPKDGVFADWYCNSEREREFGAKRHAICADWVKLYHEYKDVVDNGKGMDLQLARTIHTLANPLGLNFMDEAYICYRRLVGVLLYRHLPYKVALFIFHNIFRFKK